MKLLQQFAAVGLCAVLLPSTTALADSGMVSAMAARRAGLEVEWFTRVQLDADLGRVRDLDLQINNQRATSYFALTADGRREIISEHDLSLRGERFGIEGAEQWAQLRNELWKAEGIEGQVQKIVLPEATLYALTSRGLIHAIDADTGKTKWMTAVGDSHYPSLRLAANDNFVAALNGSRVYCLDAATGKLLWSRPCNSSPGGIAVGAKFIYVPQVTGHVQAFPLETAGIPAENFVSIGHALVDPLVTSNTVSWPSGSAQYNVARNDSVGSLTFRFQAMEEIMGTGASAGPMLIVTSMDGTAYALDERNGSIQWEFTAGEPITQAPIVIGNVAYVITDYHNLYKLDAATGNPDPAWPRQVAGIREFAAATADRVYVVDTLQQLVALRLESGSRVATVPLSDQDIVLQNDQSDRIFIGNSRGALQCLREIGAEVPSFHASATEPQQPGTSAKPGVQPDPFQPPAQDPAPQQDKPDVDPFKPQGGSDPSGGGQAKPPQDPFGGGGQAKPPQDPFGGGGQAKPPQDPFGGNPPGGGKNEDPFGGG